MSQSISIELNVNENFTTAPVGVDLQKLNLSAQIVPIGKYSSYKSATLDVGGIYTIYDSVTRRSRTYEAPTNLTHAVTSGQHQATLTIAVNSGACVAANISVANPQDAIAGIATQAPAVVAAVAALVGMSAATITSTGLPAVTAAYVSACSSPPSVPSEDAATPTLAQDGWKKS